MLQKKHGFPWPALMCLRKAAVKKRSRSELEIFAFVQPRMAAWLPLRIESLPVVMTASIDPPLPRMPPVITGERSSVIFFHKKKNSKSHLLRNQKKAEWIWKRIENHSHTVTAIFQTNGESFTEPSTLTLGFKSRYVKCSAFLGGREGRVLPNTVPKNTHKIKKVYVLLGWS